MVSVLMCTYNREKFLARAIESVLSQTYEDLEFVIVDDGSTDGTEELIRSYTDSRIKYLKQEQNSFYCHAANWGLWHCSGDYIAFMNSDDEWLPEKLERQIAFLNENRDYGACFSAAYLIDSDRKDVTDECPLMRDVFAKQYESQKECLRYFFRHGNSLCHPSAIVRKEVLDKVGAFNLMYCQMADFELWVRIVSQVPIHVMRDRLLRFRWDVKDKTQVSSDTREHAVRTFNEQVLIGRDLMNRLTDEQVREYFAEDFVKQDSNSHLEIEFERCFLLLKRGAGMEYPEAIGMSRLEQVLNLPGAYEVLGDHFGMSIFELYEMNKIHIYQDPWGKKECESQQNKIAKQRMRIESLKRENQELRKLIAEYAGSSSWRLTEPLRRLGRMVKGHGQDYRIEKVRSKRRI